MSASFQDLDTEVKDKYATVEQLIGQKAGGVVDAKKRAQALQQEAKELLLKASDKLQLLKGDITVTSHLPVSHDSCAITVTYRLHVFFSFFIRSNPERAAVFCFLFFFPGLEKSYAENQRTLEVKAEQLVELEAAVKELLQEIGHKVTIYSTCLL